MKTIYFKTAVIFLTLVFASCSNSSDSSSSVNADKTTFKLDGVLITADETTATDYDNGTAGGRYIDVYAMKDGKQILELHMPAANGTYPAQHETFTMSNSWLTYQANDGLNFPDDYFNSTSGSMVLTTTDLPNNKLRGTFSFTGDNTTTTKNITEGKLVVNTMIHQ